MNNGIIGNIESEMLPFGHKTTIWSIRINTDHIRNVPLFALALCVVPVLHCDV